MIPELSANQRHAVRRQASIDADIYEIPAVGSVVASTISTNLVPDLGRDRRKQLPQFHLESSHYAITNCPKAFE